MLTASVGLHLLPTKPFLNCMLQIPLNYSSKNAIDLKHLTFLDSNCPHQFQNLTSSAGYSDNSIKMLQTFTHLFMRCKSLDRIRTILGSRLRVRPIPAVVQPCGALLVMLCSKGHEIWIEIIRMTMKRSGLIPDWNLYQQVSLIYSTLIEASMMCYLCFWDASLL